MSLSPEERTFFTRVNEATFSNPFSEHRDQLDRSIAGAPSEGPAPELIDQMVATIRARLAGITLGELPSRDREAVEYALLFVHFHELTDELDNLIDDQAGQRKPVAVPFAQRTLSALREAGLEPTRARRALELFYQMRRAFRFIEDGLTGDTPSMRVLRESLWNHVFTGDVLRYERHLWNRMEDFGALIIGDTGAGKGQAAAALGRSGFIAFDEDTGRFETGFDELFVAVNLSEYNPSLLESELFGHRRGAFTGAVDHHDGVFARCSPHGVIFLDEIGELAPEIQVKLLRVLQERTYVPVGGREPKRFEGRVVAATHRAIETLRQDGRMRDDFYYRLCSDVITVPSLATRLGERPEERDRLIGHAVARIVDQESNALTEEVCRIIGRDVPPGYAWPGNVRELEQCVRRVLLTGRAVTSAPTPTPTEGWAGALDEGLSAQEMLDRYCGALYELHGTYEKVARITDLDRRTVKKHVIRSKPR